MKQNKKWRLGYQHILGACLFLLVAFVFILPILRLLQSSVMQDEVFSLAAYREMFTRATTWRATGNTIFITLTSTVGAMMVGTMLAWLVRYTDVRFVACIRFLAFLPFILPSYGMALAWRLFLLPNGAVGRILALLPGAPAPPSMFSYGGIIFMHIITSFPPVFLLMSAALKRVPQDMEWAARVGGLSGRRVFFHVTVPSLAPAFFSAAVLTFLAIIDNFGIPAVLGLPAGIRVLPTYIYEQIAGLGRTAFARGAALSVLLILLSMLAPVAQKLFVREQRNLEEIRAARIVRVPLGRLRTPLSLMMVFLLASLSIVPVVSMTTIALRRAIGLPLSATNFTWDNFAFVLFENQTSRRALQNSLILAGVCTVLLMILGTLLAVHLAKGKKWPKILELMTQVPYSIPGIVLSLSMILFWIQPIPGWFPGVHGTYRILLIVYITRFFIVQVKASYGAVSGFDKSLEEAARASGTAPFIGWIKVVLPLLLPSILSGAVMVFIGVLTELTLSSLLWSAGSETIGTAILSFQQAGTLNHASAMSSVVCVMVIVLYSLSRIPGLLTERKQKQRGTQ